MTLTNSSCTYWFRQGSPLSTRGPVAQRDRERIGSWVEKMCSTCAEFAGWRSKNRNTLKEKHRRYPGNPRCCCFEDCARNQMSSECKTWALFWCLKPSVVRIINKLQKWSCVGWSLAETDARLLHSYAWVWPETLTWFLYTTSSLAKCGTAVTQRSLELQKCMIWAM